MANMKKYDITEYGAKANGTQLFIAERAENKGARGRAVCIRNTNNLVIKNIKIRQSPAWCLHILYCENVLLQNIEIHSKFDENGNLLPFVLL